jgi:CheY-like chemotaxis protein
MAHKLKPGDALLAALIRELTILVVEDHAEVRQVTQLLLEDLGARVVVAVDGRDAFNRLPRVNPDLVLTDLVLPRLGGRDLLDRLRSDPVHRTLPVIAMSGWPSSFEAGAAAFDGYLDKPFDLRSLATVLSGAICAHHVVFDRQRRRLCRWAEQQRAQSQWLRQSATSVVKQAAEARAKGRALFATGA